MGGNIYKKPRLTNVEYHALVAELKPIFEKHFGVAYRMPIPYTNKPTFGDMDIILDSALVKDRDWLSPLLEELGVETYEKVRNVTSVLYKGLQVDFFCVKSSNFLTTHNFMCYNILGNLIGRLYHKFNLKYGQDGLYYVIRGISNHITKEILITKDMKQMLEFVDLSYERWEKGFNDLTDIFEYVLGSKYFCADSYSPDYFNVRKRALERPDFNTFLDYLQKNNVVKNYPFDRNKDIYLPMIDEAFPGVKILERIHEHQESQQRQIAISKKFNGKLIMDLIPLNGKELGEFIAAYKLWKGNEFEEFVLKSNQGLIDHSIKIFHTKLTKEESK